MSIGNIKQFAHYIKPFTGWFYDANNNRVNLGTKLDEVIAGGGGAPTDIAQVGELTVGASEVEIAITGTTRSIVLTADEDNTNRIWIGKTGVQNDGSVHFIYLDAGDTFSFDYDDSTNALYAISDAASQTLSVGALL